MTSEEIVYELKHNFQFLSEVIVFNNPNAVEDRIVRSYPAQFENPEAMLDVIFDFANRGNKDFVDFVLSVPFRPENATAELRTAWARIQQQAGSMAKFEDWSGGMFEAVGMIGAAALTDAPDIYNIPPSSLQNQRPNNTIWYVLGGLAFIVLIAILFMARGRS